MADQPHRLPFVNEIAGVHEVSEPPDAAEMHAAQIELYNAATDLEIAKARAERALARFNVLKEHRKAQSANDV